MNTFPVLSRAPSADGYTVTKSGDAVNIASTSSGYPVINKLFTFDPQPWHYTLDGVSQADKDSIMTFYEANKDVPFYWQCDQDSTTYEVIFTRPPDCRLAGRNKTNGWLWKITMDLMQAASG